MKPCRISNWSTPIRPKPGKPVDPQTRPSTSANFSRRFRAGNQGPNGPAPRSYDATSAVLFNALLSRTLVLAHSGKPGHGQPCYLIRFLQIIRKVQAPY
jgi:hypothetical protein